MRKLDPGSRQFDVRRCECWIDRVGDRSTDASDILWSAAPRRLRDVVDARCRDRRNKQRA